MEVDVSGGHWMIKHLGVIMVYPYLKLQKFLDEREVLKAGNMTIFWSAARKFSSVSRPKEALKHGRVSISAEVFNRFKLVSISQQSYCEPVQGITCFNPWKNGIVKGIESQTWPQLFNQEPVVSFWGHLLSDNHHQDCWSSRSIVRQFYELVKRCFVVRQHV